MEQALQHMHCHLGLLGRSAASIDRRARLRRPDLTRACFDRASPPPASQPCSATVDGPTYEYMT